MNEQKAKYYRKLNQAIQDAKDVMLDGYTLDDLENDLMKLKDLEHMPGKRKLSTKMIAGLLRWQLDNL